MKREGEKNVPASNFQGPHLTTTTTQSVSTE